jgi:glycosyltransferase involved in cell wall biosynthesis
MTSRYRVTFITIVPSPYQRDLFAAMAARDDMELRVHYMEAASPDSPWPEAPLRPFERVMPGFWVPFRGARFHFNWSLPELEGADVVVLSTFTSWTGQWLMRYGLRGKRWLFWGERLRKSPHRFREGIQRRLIAPFASAAAIVGVGRAAEADYATRFPNTCHFCVPYHCDLAAFLASPRDRESGRPVTFLFCGQMIRRKGVDLLLIAFDRLVAKGLDVTLRLVGREAKLSEFLTAVSPPARARVRYEGFQPPERLPEYFSTSDIFVLPSRHDGWGVVVNQALGAGLPVITSDAVGAGLDLVEDGINGLRFAAGDLDGLQQSMEKVATSRDEARRWGDASRRKALTLTPEAGAEKWAQVFNSIASTR